MSQATIRRPVAAKSREVIAYHRDPERPGKPLHILIPAGLIALVSLGLMIYVAFLRWFKESIPSSTAWFLLIVLGVAYLGAVFLFSYGYELYDLRKALRRSAVLAFIGPAIVAILAVVFVILREADDLPGGDSSTDSGKAVATPVPAPAPAPSPSHAWDPGGTWVPDTPASGEESPQEQLPAVRTCTKCGFQFPADGGHLRCPNCRAPLEGMML